MSIEKGLRLEAFIKNYCGYDDKATRATAKFAYLMGYDDSKIDLVDKINGLIAALEKIADPRKRDHTEPDLYTENACLMHIANEALKEWNNEE